MKSIPFDLYCNLIFLQADINKTGPCWFILDSGFEGSVINKSTLEKHGWPVGASHNEQAPGGEIEIAYSDSLEIGLDGLSLGPMKLMVLSLDGIEPVVGRVIDGIMGHDFFMRYTLHIDYESRILNVYDPARFRFSGDGRMVPLIIENNEVFIFAILESGDRPPVKAKLKLDTGSSDFIGLNGSFVAHEELFEPTHKKFPAQGAAVGGYTENYVTRLAGFRLGDIQVREPVIGYSVDTLRVGDAGTIGGDFLSRFTATFDYARHRMLLKKNKHFADPYDYDMSGIFPVAESPEFKIIKIVSVTPKSPATDAGLQANDIIVSIDGKPACDYGVAQIRQLFSIEDNHVSLEIERNGTSMHVDLVLRKLI
jgi:hypothetical protein